MLIFTDEKRKPQWYKGLKVKYTQLQIYLFIYLFIYLLSFVVVVAISWAYLVYFNFKKYFHKILFSGLSRKIYDSLLGPLPRKEKKNYCMPTDP